MWSSVFTALAGAPDEAQEDSAGSAGDAADDVAEDPQPGLAPQPPDSDGVVADAEPGDVAGVGGDDLAPEAAAQAQTLAVPPPSPWSAPGDGSEGPADFFLFIKDYSWCLRYHVSRDDDGMDLDRPLEMEWVKLRRPVRSPDELFAKTASGRRDGLIDWAVRAPPRHSGFFYQVTEAVGSGVEAAINFLHGRGPSLLVQPTGISLALENRQEEEEASLSDEASPEVWGTPITHCWVEVGGLPFFLPVPQSIAFFNFEEMVVDWHA